MTVVTVPLWECWIVIMVPAGTVRSHGRDAQGLIWSNLFKYSCLPYLVFLSAYFLSHSKIIKNLFWIMQAGP